MMFDRSRSAPHSETFATPLGSRRFLAVAFLVALAGRQATPGLAHDPGLSTATVLLNDQHVSVGVALTARDLDQLPACRSRCDANRNGSIDQHELQLHLTALREAAAHALKLRVDGAPLATTTTSVRRREGGSEVELRVQFAVPSKGVPPGGELYVESGLVQELPHGHRQHLRVFGRRGEELGAALLHRRSPSLAMQLASSPRSTQ